MSTSWEGRYAPAPQQGGINQAVFPDQYEFMQRKQNSADGYLVRESYPGANENNNLVIKAGEPLLSERGRHTSGRNSELVFSSQAGIYWGEEANDEALMRKYRFVGIATSDCDVPGGDSMYGSAALDHGFSCVKAGTESVNYNISHPGARDIFAGDLIAWTFSSTGRKGASTPGSTPGHDLDNGRNPIRSQNTYGTPLTKPVVELVPFDPFDFNPQLMASFELFSKTKTNGGISDIIPADLTDTRKNLSSLQEEALGFRDGVHGIGLAYMRYVADNFANKYIMDILTKATAAFDANTGDADAKKAAFDRELIRLARATPFFNYFSTEFKNSEKTRLDALDAVFLRHSAKGDAAAQFMKDFPKSYQKYDPADPAPFLMDKSLDLITGGIVGSFMAKASRIVGVAMHGCKRKQTFDLMISHFKPGFY